MSDEAIFTIKCAGGCGREMQTGRLTVLWTVRYCPECEQKAVK